MLQVVYTNAFFVAVKGSSSPTVTTAPPPP